MKTTFALSKAKPPKEREVGWISKPKKLLPRISRIFADLEKNSRELA
jgi:hypothetical protein